MGKAAQDGSIIAIELAYEAEVFMLGHVKGSWYKAAAGEESEWMGTIKKNDQLIDVERLAAWQPGLSVFEEAGEVVKVFIDDIRMINVELKTIESHSRAASKIKFELPAGLKIEILKLMAADAEPQNKKGHPRLSRALE